ncbi:hypothetical protein Trydic_g20147 [Trypoxylus dichotomus]
MVKIVNTRQSVGLEVGSDADLVQNVRRISGDSGAANGEREKPPEQYEDAESQAFLDEDDSQTREQLAKQLGVSQQVVSSRLRDMGKIQKIGKWIKKVGMTT